MSLVNLIKPSVDRKEQTKVSPKFLAVAFMILGGFFASAVYYPISKVFSGEWILKQNLFTIKLEYIDFLFWNFPMDDIYIRTYSVCILVGVLAGFFLSLYFAKRHYVATTMIDRLFVGLVIFGLLGARIFYVIFNWEQFEDNRWDMLLIYKGGLAIFGAIIASAIYLWVYCRKYKFNFFELADILVPGLLLGQIIGRFGNFFNYESYGGPTEVFWKMYVPEAAAYSNGYKYDDFLARFFHPTFLYEILLNFGLFILILWNYKKMTYKKSGVVLGVYFVGYGLIRAFTEFFRLDALKIETGWGLKFPNFIIKTVEWFDNLFGNKYEFIPAWFGSFEFNNIYVSQLVALIAVILGIVIWYKRNRVVYFKKQLKEFDVA